MADAARLEVAADDAADASATAALVVASLFWAAGGLIAADAPMSGPQFALWRSLAGAVVYQGVLAAQGRRLRLADLRTSLVGGLGFGFGVVFLFAAFQATTLTSAYVITALQPILLGFVATRFHRERLSGAAWGSMLVAVVGTVVVVAGSSGGGVWSLRGDLLALAGVALGALYPIGTKSARRTLSALEYQAATLWVSAGVCLVATVLVDGAPEVPSGRGWGYLALMVAVGGTGHLLFSWAQHHVSVAASSVVMLGEIVATAVGAAVLFDQPIRALQIVGMAIVCAGIVAWVREHSTPGQVSG